MIYDVFVGFDTQIDSYLFEFDMLLKILKAQIF